MRPLKKSFTNCVFSAFSCTSLVPAASISDRSSGLQGGVDNSSCNGVFNQSIKLSVCWALTGEFPLFLRTQAVSHWPHCLVSPSFLPLVVCWWVPVDQISLFVKMSTENYIRLGKNRYNLMFTTQVRLKCTLFFFFRKACTLSRIAGFIFPIVVSQLTQLEQRATTQSPFIEFTMVPEICITAGATHFNMTRNIKLQQTDLIQIHRMLPKHVNHGNKATSSVCPLSRLLQ